MIRIIESICVYIMANCAYICTVTVYKLYNLIIYSNGLNKTRYPFKLSSTSSNNGFSFFRSSSI